MHYRELGRTGLTVSALGFGCGAVGGILVNGEQHEMMRVVAYAIEEGITYFDTAADYGGGESERSLGRILQELRSDALVGTKVRVRLDAPATIEQAICESVEASLKRLRRERVDLIQLHNAVAVQRVPERHWLSVEDVALAVRTFEQLHQAGKVGCWGINGLGDTEALHKALDSGAQTIQACYNLINPSAGMQVAGDFPFQDYRQLIDRAAERGMGVLAIRVLAGGALSGSASRHPHAAQAVEPIGTGASFADDIAWARRFDALVTEVYAASPVEAAIRFVLSKPDVSTTLVGISSFEQLQEAIAAANAGPLPIAALERLGAIRDAM